MLIIGIIIFIILAIIASINGTIKGYENAKIKQIRRRQRQQLIKQEIEREKREKARIKEQLARKKIEKQAKKQEKMQNKKGRKRFTMKENLTLKLLKERYGVVRLENGDHISKWVFAGEFYSITKTEDELSIVCLEKNIPLNIKNRKCETGWRILKIEGPLDFSLVGILAKISNLMANNCISIFAISTYDTDYILIKEDNIKKAIDVLMANRYRIIE